MAEPADQTPPVAVDEPTKVVEDKAPEVEFKEPESKPVTGVNTPAESVDLNPLSRKVTLADLSAKGTAFYNRRFYEAAAETFSKASILQVELNGETAPENAEILFHYGRSLFKVGQSKSDVLGGPAASANKKNKKSKAAEKPSKAPAPEAAVTEEEKVTQEGIAIVAEKKEAEHKTEVGSADAKENPLFQFTGDENFDESDEEEGAEGEEEDEDEDDDLATAFEILDLARVCYIKRLEQLAEVEQEEAGKGKERAEGDSPTVRHVKERLADTHDCLSEISLENEQYPNAIEDGRISLKYKLELYPEESEIIAEAHFKLSLALEFASVTTAGEEGKNAKREDMDQGLRDEAVKHMELAIKSSKLKLQGKEVELATMASPEDNEMARKAIQEMKEVIGDMEQRLVDLRNDPIDTKGLLGQDADMTGILGAVIGETAAETKARVEEATKTANDLTGLVRKKKAKDTPAATDAPVADAAPAATETEATPTTETKADTNGKRKAEDEAPVEDEVAAKKVKTDE